MLSIDMYSLLAMLKEYLWNQPSNLKILSLSINSLIAFCIHLEKEISLLLYNLSALKLVYAKELWKLEVELYLTDLASQFQTNTTGYKETTRINHTTPDIMEKYHRI